MKNKYDDYGRENELNLKVVIGLYRSYFAVHRGTQRFLSDFGITASQFGVLEALYHLGDLKISDLLEKTLSTSGNMTVIVRNLEVDAYIERLIDKEDKRASRIHLTEKGRALIETIFPEHLKDLDQRFSHLTFDEKAALNHLLKKMNGL